MNENNLNWFDKLKFDVVKLSFFLNSINHELVFILHKNKWALEDINLCESIYHLRDMLTTSDRDLSEFVERINILEKANTIFNNSDLLDEFSYIQENTNLEASYLNNIKNYIEIVTNPSVNGSDITERLEQYQDTDISCYNQMKINNEQLKQLKKERRD